MPMAAAAAAAADGGMEVEEATTVQNKDREKERRNVNPKTSGASMARQRWELENGVVFAHQNDTADMLFVFDEKEQVKIRQVWA